MAVGFGGENILLNSTEPNFVRDVIETYDELVSMVANHHNNYDVGHIVFCKETGEHYVYLGSGYGGSELTEGDSWRRVDHFLKFDSIADFQDQLNSVGLPYGKLALVDSRALFYAVEDCPVLLAAKFDSVNDISEWEELADVSLEGAYIRIGGKPYYINGNYEVIKISDERDLSDKQDKLDANTELFTLNGNKVKFGQSVSIETGGGSVLPTINARELNDKFATGEFILYDEEVGVQHDLPIDANYASVSGRLQVYDTYLSGLDDTCCVQVLTMACRYGDGVNYENNKDSYGIFIRKGKLYNEGWYEWERVLTSSDQLGGDGGGDSSGSECSCNFTIVEGSEEFADFGDWNTSVVVGEELETQGTVSNEELETQGTVANEELTM